VWLTGALLLLGGLMFGVFELTQLGVGWLHDYPLIGTIAPAITRRSLEGLFLVLMAAVLFSVLVASIGTLYGSDDLELLLAQPVNQARIFGMKVAEVFINSAGLPLLLMLPMLAGVGVALDAHPLFYPVSGVAAGALFALPVALGALLALALVRVSPAGRVREVATAASIAVAAAALVGLRALRPEQLLTVAAQDSEAFERFLTTFAQLEIGWLPPTWASDASWAALTGRVDASLLLLLAVATAGLGVTGFLARLAYARGWVRSLDAAPASANRRCARTPAWERLLVRRLGTVGALLAKDMRVFTRDVQQWSQLLVLVALGAVYIVSLAAIPVPTQQFRDALGVLNVAFIGFITAGVGLRVAFPSVSYEAKAYWLVQTNPIRPRDLVVAKFLLSLPIMLALGVGLALAAHYLLDLSPILAVAAPLAGAANAIAVTGLAVGMGAAAPRFDFTNPNELATTPGAMAFMGLALLHALVVTLVLARPGWAALQAPAPGGYWSSPEGLVILAILVALTCITTLLPLWLGARQLARADL